MLQFDEEFFKDEVRCEHLVEESVKRLRTAELEVLTELIRICEKYNLTYYATLGTLLGAVRHQGFVPWDDDIDIALKRADYMRLIEILPAEIPQSWKLSSMYMQEGHNHQISCLMNSRKVIKDAKVTL